MKHWRLVLLGIFLVAILIIAPAYSVFTDTATSKGNEIGSGEFDIGISKEGSRYYNDLKLFDFSNLKPGDVIDITFYIKNRGDMPVSRLTMTLHVKDLEDGPLSPAEAKVDHTPDVGELSSNLIITAMTIEIGRKTLNVSDAVGKTLGTLNGKLIPLPVEGKLAPGETAKVTMRVWFSKDAGNECQTDSIKIDMELDAEQ